MISCKNTTHYLKDISKFRYFSLVISYCVVARCRSAANVQDSKTVAYFEVIRFDVHLCGPIDRRLCYGMFFLHRNWKPRVLVSSSLP